MLTYLVHRYDAFSAVPERGNPAGVVLEAEGLSAVTMQSIAAEVGFNETVFVLPSDRASLRLRFFTPGHEIPLCGHATMASLYALKTSGSTLTEGDSVTIETMAGDLPVRFREAADGTTRIVMRQARPEFIDYAGNRVALAESLGLAAEDLREDWPIVYGSTGTWTLLVPIASLEAFARMKPNNKLFPELLKENPRASLHPFCAGALNADADLHARHFSSPYSGTVEDPVTGTASGAMGAYLLSYIRKDDLSAGFVVEQGQELGLDGRVGVWVSRAAPDGPIEVEIEGTAAYVGPMTVRVGEE